MTFFNHIIKNADSFATRAQIDGEWRDVGLGAVEFAHDILEADVRYVLSPEVALAALQAIGTNIATLAKAIENVRLPAHTLWIEWSPKERIAAHHALDLEVRDDAPMKTNPLEYCGVMVWALDDSGRRFVARWAWAPEKPRAGAIRPEASLCEVYFDLDNPKICQSTNSYYSWQVPTEIVFGTIGRDGPPAAITDQIPQSKFVVAESERKKISHLRGESLQRALVAGLMDLSGELTFLLSVLLLLMCRNAVELETQTFEGLNRNRARRHKPPLGPYDLVTMYLSPRIRQLLQNNQVSRDQVRRHFCQGHTKIRKTGVFWWRPHMRGNPEKGAIKRSYLVKV